MPCAGGDAFISICLWQAGYAMTDPGYSFIRPEVQMFDPGPEDRMGVMMKLVRAIDHRCDEPCQVRLFTMASIAAAISLCSYISSCCKLDTADVPHVMMHDACWVWCD